MLKLLPYWGGLGILITSQATGQGFAPTATAWRTPVGGYVTSAGNDSGFFLAASSSAYSGATGTQDWELVDMNGDATLDLVVTGERAASGAVYPFGTAPNYYWSVYLGGANGFAPTATTWRIPTGGAQFGFGSTANTSAAGNPTGSQNWVTRDMDGDNKPDLVVTSERASNGMVYPFGTAAAPYWKVYLNTGSGFATTAGTWSLPAGGNVANFTKNNGFWAELHSNASGGGLGSQNWVTRDVNGDNKADLVVTGELTSNGFVSTFGTAAARYWNVYLNTGNSFASTATTWSTPAGGYVGNAPGNPSYLSGFYVAALPSSIRGVTGSQVWGMQDLNNDHIPDLVVTGEVVNQVLAPFGTAPNRYWKVYAGSPSGFSAVPTSWRTPVGGYIGSSGGDSGFYELANTNATSGAPGCQNWGTLDVTGDGRPDLVVASERTSSGLITTYGTSARSWKVYVGEVSSFATTATSWAIPAGGLLASGTVSTTSFYATTSTRAFTGATGSQNWLTTDLNGDSRPDLVVTSELADNGTEYSFGTAPDRYWKVYLSSATPLATTAPAGLVASVSLYPNPATGQLTLGGSYSLAGQPYVLLDVLGQTVRAGQLGAAQPMLDVQALPAGVYGVRVGLDGHLLRFVKQ